MGIEVGLQDENGRDLIDDGFAPQDGVPGGIEVAMGLGGGKAFVPEVDGELELGAEQFGKGLGLDGLRAEVAGHI